MPKEALFRVLSILALAGFLGESLAAGRAPKLPRGLDLAALAFFTAIVVVSVVRSGFHPLAVDGATHALAGAALFVAVADPLRGERIGGAIVSAWLVAAALASTYAIAQALGFDWLRWSGQDDAAYRVRSTFGHHSFAASFFAASLPVAIASFGASRSRSTRALAATSCVLGIVALVLTHGRAGYAGAFAALALFAGIARSREGGRLASRAAALSLVALVAVLLAVPSLRARLAESVDPDSPPTKVRLAIWNDSLRASAEHPVLGSGIGLYDVAVSEIASDETLRAAPPSRFTIGHAHQEFLEVLVELGALGLVAFAAFVGFALARGIGVRARPDLLAAGLTAAAFAVLVTNLFDVNLRGAAGAAPFFLALGLARARS
ncbi:MAG: O-antigen ligase family protein [Planctomycetes bacterium]|nr:O-antigen ligase family protein [Planctomycetota bacterium]